jgi:predicted nucleotidyltransferase
MVNLSKNEARLFRLFYTNPDQEFYIQEIGRILGKKPGVFQRILYSMEDKGILRSEYRANARYFSANKDYPLYEEYKSVVLKTVGIIGSLKEVLDKAGPIDFSFIYGSFAKSRENYLSDIDLVVIGAPDENTIIREFDKLEEYLKREINYKLYSLREFRVSVRRQDPFLLEILKDQNTMLIGGEDELRKVIEGPSYKEAKSRPRTSKNPAQKG